MRNGRIPPVSRETVATYTRKPWRRQYRSALDEGARSHRYGRLIGAATMSSTDPTSGPP
jgi:hypothetical protein